MCEVYTAWSKLIEAATEIETAEPFRYDLVNTGRCVTQNSNPNIPPLLFCMSWCPDFEFRGT